MNFEITSILVFIISLICGFIINNFFIKRPIKFLVKKANISAIRWSSQSKPIFGGITFFVVFLGISITSFFVIGEDIYFFPEYLSLLLVVILSFFMGLADDIISTPPSFKFIVQIICAMIFIFNGFYIHISPHEWINYTITIIWVLGIMNSINMLDNMDAITCLTSLSIIGGVVISSFLGVYPIKPFILITLIGISGALLSFLFYNWSPSRMYMGDNGSQFVGAILAFTGILYFWNSVPISELGYSYNTTQFVLIALAFVIPISDTTTVTINRLLKKQSPFIGGKDHTTHHLFYAGLPTRWIAVLLFLLNTIGVVLALYIISRPEPLDLSSIWLFAGYPILVFLALYINTKISKAQ